MVSLSFTNRNTIEHPSPSPDPDIQPPKASLEIQLSQENKSTNDSRESQVVPELQAGDAHESQSLSLNETKGSLPLPRTPSSPSSSVRTNGSLRSKSIR